MPLIGNMAVGQAARTLLGSCRFHLSSEVLKKTDEQYQVLKLSWSSHIWHALQWPIREWWSHYKIISVFMVTLVEVWLSCLRVLLCCNTPVEWLIDLPCNGWWSSMHMWNCCYAQPFYRFKHLLIWTPFIIFLSKAIVTSSSYKTFLDDCEPKRH